MPGNLLIVDDFLPTVSELRAEALRLPFYDIRFGGEVFKRIHVRGTDEFKENLEAVVHKKIEQTYSFFRLNYAGERQHDAVHHDAEMGGFVGVLYLTENQHCSGGTALWKHRETERVKFPSELELRREGRSPMREQGRLQADFENVDKWEIDEFSEMKFNRLVIFPAECFHSRYPHEAFGNSPENGRLIWITFFQCLT